MNFDFEVSVSYYSLALDKVEYLDDIFTQMQQGKAAILEVTKSE